EGNGPQLHTFGRTSDEHPLGISAAVTTHPLLASAHEAEVGATRTAQRLTDLALAPGSSSLERLADGTAIDAGGLVPDLHHTNSWVHTVDEVDARELLEVQLCNETAPFIL